MTLTHAALASPSSTPYFHCIGGCVRRSFICVNSQAGNALQPYRERIVTRLAELVPVFAVSVCAYAVMANHYQLVLRVDHEQAGSWSETEVLERWCSLFSGPVLIQRYRLGETLTEVEKLLVADRIQLYRSRLSDLAWFMRYLSDQIATIVNTHTSNNDCYHEAQFTCEALPDNKTLIGRMLYVDLSPVRAGMVKTPEQCGYTSIQQRLAGIAAISLPTTPETKPGLLEFGHRQNALSAVPCTIAEYRTLTNWSATVISSRLRNLVKYRQPEILQQLEIDANRLIRDLNRPEHRFAAITRDRYSIRQSLFDLAKKLLKKICLVPAA